MVLSNSSILFADGAEGGVAVGFWPPQAINRAVDAKITANWFLEVVFIGTSKDPRFVRESPDSKILPYKR
jgi:hypothetical protein